MRAGLLTGLLVVLAPSVEAAGPRSLVELLNRVPELQRDRAELTRLMEDGDRVLAPTQYGAGARSQVNRTWLTGYHQSLLGEIEQLIDQTQTAAKRASDVVNAGVERLFWASANR